MRPSRPRVRDQNRARSAQLFRMETSYTKLIIYDGTTPRPQNSFTGSLETGLLFTFGADASTLYAYDATVISPTMYQPCRCQPTDSHVADDPRCRSRQAYSAISSMRADSFTRHRFRLQPRDAERAAVVQFPELE